MSGDWLRPGTREDPLWTAMNKIYKQLTAVLTDLGVTAIEAVGKEFDPNFHNAVMHVDDESVGRENHCGGVPEGIYV